MGTSRHLSLFFMLAILVSTGAAAQPSTSPKINAGAKATESKASCSPETKSAPPATHVCPCRAKGGAPAAPPSKASEAEGHANPPSKKPAVPKPPPGAEDEQIIEEMDFLILLEMLKDYDLISDDI